MKLITGEKNYRKHLDQNFLPTVTLLDPCSVRQSNAAAENTFKHAERQSDVLSCVLVLPAAPQATRSGSGCNGFPRGRRSPVKPPEPSS